MNQLPIKDRDGWYKNTESGSIQSADTVKYEKFMKNYKAAIAKDTQLDTLQTDLSELKSEMDEIKSLLKTLANKTVL
tara:strand:+ start:777 stop:1007 length:231 start_codon:yes stop_codon:yes gene_type:complete